jgi:hypothetical protein
MKYAVSTALFSILLLLLPASALAADTISRTVNIPTAVVVQGQHLRAGHYKVQWQGAGPRVEVNFMRNGKIVATVPAILRTNDFQAKQDDIETRQSVSNQNVLQEIDFGHQKEALTFAMNQNNGRS